MESVAGDDPQLHTTLDIYWGSWKGYQNYLEHLCSSGNFLAREMPCADRPDLSSGKWHRCHQYQVSQRTNFSPAEPSNGWRTDKELQGHGVICSH